jgi:hypothetical protein
MKADDPSQRDSGKAGRPARPDGPVETYPWPAKLEAHVVTPGHAPRVHGYDVEADVALHYSFADHTLLTLTGEIPREDRAVAFELALHFLAPLSVAHAPTHAAVLSRICGARWSSVSGVAAVTLAERARRLLDEHGELFEWLGREPDARGEPPSALRARDDDERSSVRRLRAALSARLSTVPALAPSNDLGRTAALLAVLHFSGLEHREQMEAALVLAGFASAVAEARTRAVASFREYPMNLPRFVYEENDG